MPEVKEPSTVKPKPSAIELEPSAIELKSTIECPHCHGRKSERMPTDACLYFYDCCGCGAKLQAKAGDCCVFCSYGTIPCPPIQQGNSCA